jgi:hypothetical protein
MTDKFNNDHRCPVKKDAVCCNHQIPPINAMPPEVRCCHCGQYTQSYMFRRLHSDYCGPFANT